MLSSNAVRSRTDNTADSAVYTYLVHASMASSSSSMAPAVPAPELHAVSFSSKDVPIKAVTVFCKGKAEVTRVVKMPASSVIGPHEVSSIGAKGSLLELLGLISTSLQFQGQGVMCAVRRAISPIKTTHNSSSFAETVPSICEEILISSRMAFHGESQIR